MRLSTLPRRLLAAFALAIALPAAASALIVPRFAHTATLLTSSGTVLVTGGMNTGGYLQSAELITSGSDVYTANSMTVARASHTATFMPNGMILIAGGVNASGAVQSVEVYNPATQQFTLVGNMSNARYNHTATLLQDGRVLLCGGQDTSGNVWASCDAYNPTTNSLNDGVATLNAARALHTAVLLRDGTVWFAGGWNPAAAGTFLTTTERFYPATNSFSVAAPLNQARAWHTATVMGDGRVLVAGGFNGVDPGNSADPTDPLHNYGYLDTTEIYDPTSNETSPSTRLNFRRMMHTALLSPDGTVNLHGGLGNVSPQSLETGLAAESGSLATNTSGADSFTLTNPTFGAASITLQLPVAASGTIISGEIDWAGQGGSINSAITFTSGTVYMSLNPTPLAGIPVTCGASGCGIVNLPVSLTVTGTTIGFDQTAFPATTPVNLASYPGTFTSSATVIIYQMLLASGESYNEATGAVTIGPQSFVPHVQHAQVLSPSGDQVTFGGQTCTDANCTTISPTAAGESTITAYNDFSAVNSMDTARAYHTATLLPDGTILVAGGQNAPTTPLASATVYSPTLGVFTDVGPMSLPRSNHTATLMTNGRVLVAGGFTNSVSTGPTNVAEIYYPNTKIFVPTAPMITARANHTATLMPDGTVIVLGGQSTSGTSLSAAEVYSSTAVAWSSLAAMPTALAYHTATLLQDGRLLVIGGSGALGASAGVYAYTPATNSWATLASLPQALYQHTATLLYDGRVLVAGGNNNYGEVAASYYYSPTANTWTLIGAHALTNGRFGHTSTLLPNGSVMITGGFTVNGAAIVVAGAEVFHVEQSTWSPIGTLSGFRAAHTMTLANNGKVYAIGGTGGGSAYLATAEAGDFSASPDAQTTGAPPSLRQSSITAISPYPFTPGAALNVAGNTFEGGSEASGGGPATMDSSFSYPHLVLQQFGGSGGGSSQSDAGFGVDLTGAIYSNFPTNASTLNTSLTVNTPLSPSLPYGWYVVRTGANDIYSKGLVFQVGPALPTSAPASISGFALGTSSISWSWSQVVGSIGGYDVYQATSAVFIGTAPVSATPSFIQSGLQPNTTGSVVVAAYTLSGDGPLILSSTYFTLAAAPTLVQLSSVTPNSVLVQWNQSNNAPGAVYEISQSTDDFVTSFSTPVPASLLVTTNSYTVGALLPSTTYYFRLRAFNAQNLPSGFSSVVSTETTSAVGGVTGVALSPTSIQWSWTATAGATQYDIFVATTGQLDGTSTTTVFTDNNLGVDTARQILVGAVTGAGLGPLAASTTIYTLTDQPGPVAPPYMSISTGSFVVNWANNGNPPGINYEAAVSVIAPVGGVETLVVSTVTTANLFAAVNGLSPSRYAQATIYAVNGNGILSAPYVVASTETLANPPVSLVITANTSNSISVSWGTNSNSTSTYYQVTYSSDDFVTNVATAVTFANGANLSTATVTGLLTSTTYWIAVQAENQLGDLTSFSNIVTTVTSNGGAPPGLLQGVLPAATTGQISGGLGNGEYVTLNSPAGAFYNNTTVLISSYNVPGPLCPGAVNIGVALSATPSVLPMRGLTLILSYTTAELGVIAPGEATILRYVPSEGVCVPLNTTVNTTALTLSAEINDFGLFVVAAPPLFGSADSARAYPNPYHVNRDGYVTIDQIPAGSRVRILDLRGDVVLDQAANQSGLVTWSATNGSGRNVASGLYLVIVEGGGAKKIMKLAVIR
jgi:hypothetical protein